MSMAVQQIHAQAIEAATRCLKQAAIFAVAHIDKPLFKKPMKRRGAPAVLVRLDYPGVLRVIDPATGELLAESVPGKPDQLAPTIAVHIKAR